MRNETQKRRRELLRAARAVVRARYRDPELSLAAVAAAIGSSPRQLQRVFREAGGEDFRTHLLGVRMREAHRLLVERDVPAYKVAPRVGYSGASASGLRLAFKRYYGVTPSAVQRPGPEYLGTTEFPDDGQQRTTVPPTRTKRSHARSDDQSGRTSEP